MPLPDFHSSNPYTLGIELELQVVNPPGYDLSQDSSALITAVEHDITLAANYTGYKSIRRRIFCRKASTVFRRVAMGWRVF